MKNLVRQSPLFFTILRSCFILACTTACLQGSNSFCARNGILDTREWDAASVNSIRLTGTWEIYRDKLLAPPDFRSSVPPTPDGYFDMQKDWSKQRINGTYLSESGCVTFRLIILPPRTNLPLACKTGRIMTSFRLWNNGQLIAGAGHPGCTPRSTVAIVKPQIVPFCTRSDSIELILQIANYHFDKAGITGFDKNGTIEIGAADKFFRQQSKSTMYDTLLCGAFIVMAIYHFALFLFGKHEKSLPYLGAICLLMLVHIARQSILMDLWPTLPWETYSRVINIPVFALCGFFLLFFHTLYPEEAKKRTILTLTAVSLFFVLAATILPQKHSLCVYTCYVPFMVVQIIFMIKIILRAAWHQRNSAKYLVVASWLVALAALNDVLNGYGIVITGYVIPTSGFFFILMCEFGIYERFARAEQFAELQKSKLVETEKLASLGTIVAGVAHEINNPNNSILLTSQQLLEIWHHVTPVLDNYHEQQEVLRVGGFAWEQLRSEIPASFERITRNSRRIERIVTDLKTYARKDIANSIDLVDINMVVRGSISLLENTIKNSTDAFTVAYFESTLFVKGNFQKLEQVVINLLVNACQSLADRSKAVRVETAYDAPNKRVIITISDEGCGIEQNILRQIFVPFFTTKHNTGGTGLGLSIAQSIITSHNGELKILSEAGTGTRAIINLPGTEAQENG